MRAMATWQPHRFRRHMEERDECWETLHEGPDALADARAARTRLLAQRRTAIRTGYASAHMEIEIRDYYTYELIDEAMSSEVKEVST